MGDKLLDHGTSRPIQSTLPTPDNRISGEALTTYLTGIQQFLPKRQFLVGALGVALQELLTTPVGHRVG